MKYTLRNEFVEEINKWIIFISPSTSAYKITITGILYITSLLVVSNAETSYGSREKLAFLGL
jgi:hypothetical protein